MNTRRWMLTGCLLALASAIACSSGGQESTAASGNRDWQLSYSLDGSEVTLALDHMHVYLVEEYDEYPEVFELEGEGVTLVGSFPMDCHVGYEADWKVLLGREIPIDPSGGARDDKLSFVQLPGGERGYITDGSLVPQQITGKIEGTDGEVAITGTFRVRFRNGIDEQELTGRFTVHCLTLG